jgi:NADH:ubiquinone oxidoreductase subunit E
MSHNISSITICMGSSCFSRGNKKTVSVLKDYLKEKKLDEFIVLKGDHCMGQCCHGPVLKINDELICQAHETDIESILDIRAGLKEE